MSFGNEFKCVGAMKVARYLKNNLKNAYHNEPTESFVINYKDLKYILDVVYKNLDSGGTQQSFKKAIKEKGIILPKELPETFYRTILQGCFMAEKWKKINASVALPYIMYDAINDGRVRSNHLEISGIIRRRDDNFWKTHFPPNGINCRCGVRSLSERQAEERSKDGQGLNKLITFDMNPDENWAFNVGEDLSDFMKVGVIALAKVDAVYSDC